MNTREKYFKDSAIQNWLKSVFCLYLVKKVLEGYAEIKSKEFHDAVLTSVAKLKTLQTSICDNEIISFDKYNRGTITCNHTFCQGFLDAIIHIGLDPNRKYTIQKTNVKNCDVSLWHETEKHWELAKLFMNPGQKSNQTNPSQTDLSGIINFLDHCKIPRGDIKNFGNIEKVRQARNDIMHSGEMKMTAEDFKQAVGAMIALLEDPMYLKNMKEAQEAVKEIKEIISSDLTEEQWKLSILLILTHFGAALAGYVAALGILKEMFDSFVNIFANEEDVTDEHIKGLKILMQIASEKLADSEFKPRQSILYIKRLIEDEPAFKESVEGEILSTEIKLEIFSSDCRMFRYRMKNWSKHIHLSGAAAEFWQHLINWFEVTFEELDLDRIPQSSEAYIEPWEENWAMSMKKMPKWTDMNSNNKMYNDVADHYRKLYYASDTIRRVMMSARTVNSIHHGVRDVEMDRHGHINLEERRTPMLYASKDTGARAVTPYSTVMPSQHGVGYAATNGLQNSRHTLMSLMSLVLSAAGAMATMLYNNMMTMFILIVIVVGLVIAYRILFTRNTHVVVARPGMDGRISEPTHPRTGPSQEGNTHSDLSG